MNVLVTGSSGFLGSALVELLVEHRHDVLCLVRPPAIDRPGTVFWDPDRGVLDPSRLDWADAVVHLAGAGVGRHRWSPSYKETILRSRTAGTRLLAESIAGVARPPRALLTASAIGIYGDRGDEVLTEASAPGEGFRANVCQAWEAAAQPAVAAGVRVVPLRFGIVLGASGGLLPLLLGPARRGLGMRLGSGRQFMSWISLPDAMAAALWVLDNEGFEGLVNVTAPHPVTNSEFARHLAEALQRPTLGHIPAWALQCLAGRERANEVLLSSQRAIPSRLVESGFRFDNPEVVEALRAAIDDGNH